MNTVLGYYLHFLRFKDCDIFMLTDKSSAILICIMCGCFQIQDVNLTISDLKWMNELLTFARIM